MDAEVIEQPMTDGSVAHAVQFEAKHGDCTRTLVTIACINKASAERLAQVMNHAGAYAESDTVGA